jgi:acyl-CoA synthetase (AMP-forming)/AMP-acid ligase II
MIADAYQAIPAARAVICPINTRLTPLEIAYILEHSRTKLILVDSEYAHLIKHTKIPVILSNDTGRAGDPYEDFLSRGRRFSQERGWWGLEPEPDEDAGIALCYT